MHCAGAVPCPSPTKQESLFCLPLPVLSVPRALKKDACTEPLGFALSRSSSGVAGVNLPVGIRLLPTDSALLT